MAHAAEGLVAWADAYAARLAAGPGRDGVVIGGSIARHQHWEHSDLEVGVLVEAPDRDLTHFSADEGRGVEIFQLTRVELARELDQVRDGDLEPAARWPVQLWQGRVVHDPTGLLAGFIAQFDRCLFDPNVLERRIEAHKAVLDRSLERARGLLEARRPRASLTLVRTAMNELIQICHWRCRELPRSQNRTASRFRALSETYGLAAEYGLFHDVFGLDGVDHAVARAWPECRAQVLELTELWEGRRSREFFTVAVDSNFEWGEDDGIICVYRLYVPLMGAPDRGVFSVLDDPSWADSNTALLRFLGLEDASAPVVEGWAERVSSLS